MQSSSVNEKRVIIDFYIFYMDLATRPSRFLYRLLFLFNLHGQKIHKRIVYSSMQGTHERGIWDSLDANHMKNPLKRPHEECTLSLLPDTRDRFYNTSSTTYPSIRPSLITSTIHNFL